MSSHILRRALVTVFVLSPLVGLTACQQLTNPAAQAELQQSMYDLQDMLVGMREETALLQSQVDSLRFVAARQDTTLRQLANLLGAPMR